MTKEKKNKDAEYSLLHPMAMGGIYGGDGYTFQDRYIVCHIPRWVADKGFVHIMSEASGDVDVVYNREGIYKYDHIQVKDHNVTARIFKEIISNFSFIDQGTGKVYDKFTLTAPSVGSDLKSLISAVERYRSVKELYSKTDTEALKTTTVAISQKIKQLGLETYSDFLLSKVFFEINSFDLGDNDICRDMFAASLLEHPVYREHLKHVIKPVYAFIIEQVLAHRGKIMENTKILSFINDALSTGKTPAAKNVMHLHNWELAKFDIDPTLNLDWTDYFDRQTRKIPEPIVWNETLLPELYTIKKELAKSSANRHIIFRGKCALSTGVALGMIFPEIGNWIFELQQPPQPEPWRSDVVKINGFAIKHKVIAPGSIGVEEKDNEIAVIFNITGKAFDEVVLFLKQYKVGVKKIIIIEPSTTPGTLSIKDSAEAVSLASASKDILKAMVSKFKAVKTHLFYFGPFGLSVFLGQKLTSVGQVQLYEFQDPGYKPSCLLKS